VRRSGWRRRAELVEQLQEQAHGLLLLATAEELFDGGQPRAGR
jgi:hypothetical protein